MSLKPFSRECSVHDRDGDENAFYRARITLRGITCAVTRQGSSMAALTALSLPRNEFRESPPRFSTARNACRDKNRPVRIP